MSFRLLVQSPAGLFAIFVFVLISSVGVQRRDTFIEVCKHIVYVIFDITIYLHWRFYNILCVVLSSQILEIFHTLDFYRDFYMIT